MGVSLQQYRSHIGIYNSSGRIKLNKKKQGYSNNNVKSKPLNFLLLLFFFSMCNPIVQDYNRRPAFNLHQTFCSFLPYNNISTNRASFFNHEPIFDVIVFPTISLGWSYSNKANALSHALTGNRRRLGYKLAVWNCRKGL